MALVGVGMYLILSVNPLSVPDFKKLHAILNIKGSRVVQTQVSPAGSWLTVDDYAEFDDVSMTNNYGAVATASPPRTWGLYRDAQRVAPLARDIPSDFSYLAGSLSYFPYTIRPKPAVLLVGTNGGMKLMESARSGAVSGVALEQPGDIYRIVRDRLTAIDPAFETALGHPAGARHRFFPAAGRAAAVRHHRRGERLPVTGRQQLLVVHAGGDGAVPPVPAAGRNPLDPGGHLRSSTSMR